MADQLESRADASTPAERTALTAVVDRIADYARHLITRHRKISDDHDSE